ncbi:hypothetical protein C8R44DRAFT_745481 [Mycena epipterygia]|nr:hypothetical protein C8R44DRAFT_745481 [Mycena epipterygia]
MTATNDEQGVCWWSWFRAFSQKSILKIPPPTPPPTPTMTATNNEQGVCWWSWFRAFSQKSILKIPPPTPPPDADDDGDERVFLKAAADPDGDGEQSLVGHDQGFWGKTSKTQPSSTDPDGDGEQSLVGRAPYELLLLSFTHKTQKKIEKPALLKGVQPQMLWGGTATGLPTDSSRR